MNVLRMKAAIDHTRLKLMQHGLDDEAAFLARMWSEYMTMRDHLNSQPLIGEKP